MAWFTRIQIILLFAVVTLTQSNAYDKEMTINVEAGTMDCFYQHVKTGEVIDIDYQVIDGSHGDLDISFTLSEPVGLIIVSDFKKSENIHRYEAKKDGDYRFCFDNSFSTFNRKTVFFELVVEKEGGENDAWHDILEGLSPEEFYEMKVQDIMDYIGRIRMHIVKARQLQDVLRSNEARDRNIAENNYFKVNFWSFFQICAMILVGGLQVVMVRSIFETDSKLKSLWHKLGL
ncbi:transmembrane emp24 domain-containing protein 1 [Eupeodes corollae]|uniref:transmembrane emp24 domain-containing protein 1 n=1 Tax=Eupeodes corollae TaxID=290404 RepID=UPI0024920381|nr:transmembrane emp24 domain-containing protein 1 [Eupeodes corollae]